MSQKTIVIMAGGTGGHVFPGLAVAHELKAQGWRVHWLGTRERMEADLVPRYGYPIHFINIQGVRGNGLLRKLKAPFKILGAMAQARALFQQLKPDLVLGMGGYASGPGALAARLMGIPVVLHEQNAVAGMTNRYVAKFANRVLMAFPGAFAQNNAEVVGNPVREELVNLAKPVKAEPSDKVNILVFGGSLGAQVFNQQLPQAFAALAQQQPLNVWHQTGKGNSASVVETYAQQGFEPHQVADFIHDMAAAYQWADLVICRAGALTVSELAAVGLPAIFVPLPIAVDDHQTKNAGFLVDAGAGVILPQQKLGTEQVIHELSPLLASSDKRSSMANAARSVAITDAAQRVARICQEVAQ